MTEEYVTTNVRLPKSVHRALKHCAVEEDKSLAQIIRESVAAYLARPPGADEEGGPEGDRAAWERDTLWSIGADPTPADVTDGSIHHDRYLYGDPEGAADES
jgi:hypothetical protein